MPCRVFDGARPSALSEGSEKRAGRSRASCWRFPRGRSRRFSTTSNRAGQEMNDQPHNPLTRQGMDYGETADVHQVHAAIQREKREPRVGLEPLSIWLIVVYGLALFTGGAYLGRFSGNFSGDSLDIAYIPPKTPGPGGAGAEGTAKELSPAERGKKIFAANCQ